MHKTTVAPHEEEGQLTECMNEVSWEEWLKRLELKMAKDGGRVGVSWESFGKKRLHCCCGGAMGEESLVGSLDFMGQSRTRLVALVPRGKKKGPTAAHH